MNYSPAKLLSARSLSVLLGMALSGGLVAGCSEEQATSGQDFPSAVDSDKADVFGRSLVSVAAPYEARLDLAARAPELASNMATRRSVAWETAYKALEPKPLLGLLDTSAANDLSIPLGDIPEVPAFQTWYGLDDVKRIFARALDNLGPSGRSIRESVSEENWQDAIAWNASSVERSTRWPLERYLDHIRDLQSCPEGVSASECQLIVETKLAGALTGTTRILYSPATVKHLVSNYSKVLDCLGGLDELAIWELPLEAANFSQCFEAEFPPNAAVIKAQWSRAGEGHPLPVFDTDAESMKRRLDGQGDWGSEGDRQAEPSAHDIYTIRLRNGIEFRLAGLHVMTKETRHWQWVTLWWSDTPKEDFGADRPSRFDELNPLWSNYKLCAVSEYREEDAELANRFAGEASLQAAIAVTQEGPGKPTWCSNPYLEHGRNNARTNCIGCHQHAGSVVAFDLDNDGALEPFSLESVIGNNHLYPETGREKMRGLFPSDYLFAFNRVDDLAGLLKSELKFATSSDRDRIAPRVDAIEAIEGDPLRGEELFLDNCAACHGEDALGSFFAPSLEERLLSRSERALVQSIVEGRGGMPAWGEALSNEAIASIYAYLQNRFAALF